MNIVQDAYAVPDYIMEGLENGSYVRFGSVVRNAKGGSDGGDIVKHLDSITPEASEEKKELQTGLAGFITKNRKTLLLGGAVIGAGLIGTVAYRKWKKREPKEYRDFREKLKVYLRSVRSGTMTLETIVALESALAELRTCRNHDEIIIHLSMDEMETLVDIIADYTRKLMTDNNFDESTFVIDEAMDTLDGLNRCLEMQRTVFERAA